MRIHKQKKTHKYKIMDKKKGKRYKTNTCHVNSMAVAEIGLYTFIITEKYNAFQEQTDHFKSFYQGKNAAMLILKVNNWNNFSPDTLRVK